MPRRRSLESSYVAWLEDLCVGNIYGGDISYHKLIDHLYKTPFRYSIKMDSNRVGDGLALRYRYLCSTNREGETITDNPCSVLEVMVALALRCEETIMMNSDYGDRTQQWFWSMINSLGLGVYYDDNFNKKEINDILDRWLDREFEPDGRGSLFTLRHPKCDMRDVEIWFQFNHYLAEIIK